MSTAAELVASHREIWDRLTGHPFVREAGDGSLPPQAFDRWLEQDHAFVIGFRRFLARLVEIAPDEPARDLIAAGLGPLGAELELFRDELDRRGLDADAEPSPTTLGYTSYLLSSPADGYDVALTVLYGAERAYHDAWSAVRERARGDSPYWRFIDNWSSASFGEWVDGLGDLLDRARPGGPDPRSRVAFGRVVRFELRFWDAVHAGEVW